MSAVFSTLLLLDHLASGIISLETKLYVVFFISVGLLPPIQSILVRKRRCSGHWLVQYTAMASYYLGAPLAFYAVHAVCSTPSSQVFVSLSGTSLVLPLLYFSMYNLPTTSPFSSNMRAYSLRDGPQVPYRFVLSLVYLACVEWEWWTGISSEYSEYRDLLVGQLVSDMFLHFVLLLAFLFFSNRNPTESTLDYNTKAVAEYMKRESKSSSLFFDDGSGSDGDANSSLQLNCCRYPFTQRRKDGRWISIKDLTERADLSQEDQDIWLSYSLGWLLARRYYGFHCAEEADAKVRRFAMARLGTDDGGYKRAFEIVEVQLAFLHDYFFTSSLDFMKLSTLYIQMWAMMAELPTATCRLSLLVFQLALGTQEHDQWIFWFLTVIMILCILITPELRPLAIYWRPIHIVFHKLDLQAPSIWFGFFRHIYHSPNELNVHRSYQTQTRTVYWRDKLGQYSLLLDYDRRRSLKKALVAWFLRLVRPQPWYRFIKHLPLEEEDVRVPDSVRELVAGTLQAIDGPPTNGTRSLKINMDSTGYDWSWTCRQQTHTSTILIWHIATCYCDMSLRHSDWLEEDFPLLVETDTFHEVATTLSRYCAYLVAFLPEFLPEHSLITKEVFQNVIQDAQRALGFTHMEKEKHTKIRQLKLLPRSKQTTFHKGVRLGRQLEKLNTRLRWKVMAEFWTETILYVAPSNNAESHIEHLAKGGEFITHLWAMLSNAGILKRAEGEWHPPASSTKLKEPPKKMETTKARTQECPF